MEPFHAALQGLRAAAGFASSRAFFLGRGGMRFFGCTYKQYGNAEAGRSTPSPRLVDRIAAALRLEPGKPDARRFMHSYLSLLLGSERLAGMAFGAQQRDAASAMDSALAKPFEKPRHISIPATAFIYAAPENYWAFMILTNDSGSWSPEDLSRVAQVPVGRMKKALTGLRRFKIAVLGRDGRWRSPLYDFPLCTAQALEKRAGQHDLLERHLGLDRGRGQTVARRYVLLRASAADIAHFTPVLVQALAGIGAFATTEAGPDTGLYMAHGRVRRITSF